MSEIGMLQQLSEFSAGWEKPEAAEGMYRPVKAAYNVRSKITHGAASKEMTGTCLGLSRNALRYRLSKIGIDDNEAE
jgi:DNA-binding NtrC family response regulator